MSEKNVLPQGWKWTTLESIAEIVLGQSPPSSTYNQNKEGLPFYQGKTQFGDIYPTPRKWCSVPKKIAEAGDVLISVRAPVGPTNICRETSCIGRGLAAIRPLDGMPTKFILHLLRAYEHLLAGKGTGTTFKAITGKQLRELEIPIPPLPEQERIVAKIEELFTQLDAGVAELEQAKAQLKRYRQSVLKSAVEGELTREWRESRQGELEPASQLQGRILAERREKWEEEQLEKFRAKGKEPKNNKWKAKYKEPAAPDIEDLPDLPEGWTWASWEMTLSPDDGAFRRGPFGSTLKKSLFVESGYKVYEQYCPINDDPSFERYYITEELYKNLKSFHVQGGDYLISCSGVTLGRITRVPEVYKEGVINQALLRVRMNENLIAHKYFVHYFRSAIFQKLVFASSTGSAIPNLKGVKELKKLPFPIPSVQEQHRIVEMVERRLSVADEIEKELDQALVRAERLRQSVLKSAFEGRLV